jgi:hypothetical protein
MNCIVIENGCICFNHESERGKELIPLCNFNARVTDEITKDNGLETSTLFRYPEAPAGGERCLH